MKRIIVKNLSNVVTHSAEFETQELAEAWISEQRSSQSWGLVAYTQTHDENGDELETPIEHEDQFTVEITDISAEVSMREAMQTLDRKEAFGKRLAKKFAIENIVLGINAEQSDSVMNKLEKTLIALEKGYFETAIRRAKQINPSQYDGTFVTAARLLQYVNEIEAELGVPLSEEL